MINLFVQKILVACLFLPVLIFYPLFLRASSENMQADHKVDRLVIAAQKEISANNYFKAESLIKKAISKDSTSIKAFMLLYDISDELLKTDQKKYALHKVIFLDSLGSPLAYKLLASIYFEEGDYDDALKNYQQYQYFQVKKDSAFILRQIMSCRFAVKSILEDRSIPIVHLDQRINTSLQEYWPAISTDDSTLYFTRLIRSERQFDFERIFVSHRTANGWGESYQMNFTDDDDVNIGTMCFSTDGNLLFFTACGRNDGYGSCDIFYCRKINDQWSRPVNAGSILNSPYWEAQPSVSSDSRYLYFASNRPGGFGGMDIWRSVMSEMKDGSLFFTKPENLGRHINSQKNDYSPFIHADGVTLYFASEGRFGFGGSDLFISRLSDSVWSEAQNLGFPINSRKNEDGLVVSPSANVVVFSSDRDSSIAGSKDIYQLSLPPEFMPSHVTWLKGFVYDKESGKKLTASVEITELESGKTKVVNSDRFNGYTTTLIENKDYAMNCSPSGYLFYSHNINLTNPAGIDQPNRFDVLLDPVRVGKTVTLSNIFFDFDSDVLKEESNAELVVLTNFLRQNPGVKIEISGYTDNIGTTAYNQTLSENRAKAIYNYLIRFIDSSRLAYKGYGSDLPVVSNDSEAGRALNRRVEIKILSN